MSHDAGTIGHDSGTDLIDALAAHRGIVCAVGAGGKKTTLYALAARHPGRVGITTTVTTVKFPRRLDAQIIVSEAEDPAPAVTEAARHARVVAWARPSPKSGRLAGVMPASVAGCHTAGRFDLTLVKADGARMRAIKAPSADEPVVPPGTDTVLVLVSAGAFGRPLDEKTAHRPERIAAVTGLAIGDPISPAAVASLLAAPDGALRNLPDAARVIPVINAVDDDIRDHDAREAARLALAATDRFDRVVLTSHREADPLRGIVERE